MLRVVIGKLVCIGIVFILNIYVKKVLFIHFFIILSYLEDDDLEQYPFGGNPSLNIPSTPQRTPQTTTTTTTQSPPIVIEDHNTGGGDVWTPDQTFGGNQFGGSSSNNGGASFDPGKQILLNFNPYNKVNGCLYVCLYRWILLTAELLLFSFTGLLLKGPGKIWRRVPSPSQEKSPLVKKISLF